MELAMKERERLSIPAAGRTVSAATEERAAHVRNAVQALRSGMRIMGLASAFHRIFGPRLQPIGLVHEEEPAEQRAAWALVNVLLLARLHEAADDFESAERWFLPPELSGLNRFVAAEARKKAITALRCVEADAELSELFPYITEPHGPGTRLSVLKDPSTRSARRAKKRSGVFYTPADVAEYMVSTVVPKLPKNARVFDPACGNGVFLLAMLRHSGKSLNYVLDHLYGADISAQAIETCVFSLLNASINADAPPWFAWQAIRMNLVASDALRLNAVLPSNVNDSYAQRKTIRQQLLAGTYLPPAEQSIATYLRQWKAPGHASIFSVFPEARDGFDSVIGNPPYARLGKRDDAAGLKTFDSLRDASPTANVYPLFIEMMSRFTRHSRGCSSLVVPLSIAFHQGQQYVACRRSMQAAGGKWLCAFFDREPHALFGEDVKTRNAIVFHSYEKQSDQPASLAVTPLMKWTSRTRKNLFPSISFTDIGPVDFELGLPKLGSEEEAKAYTKLASLKERFRSLYSSSLGGVQADAAVKHRKPRVFVASTAYNFLNVFQSFNCISHTYPVSENKVHCFEFASKSDANLAFALLSSRLVFWLWHSQGDGFHVGRKFIDCIPFNVESFNSETRASLSEHGRRLWNVLQDHRIVSVNRGRQTVAFRPLACTEERDDIDRTLVQSAKLPLGFVHTLRSFVERVVVVDAGDHRRNHLKEYFSTSEAMP